MGDTTRIECELNARTRRYKTLVQHTLGKIRWLPDEKVSVSISWGKDSTVLMDIVLSVRPDARLMFIDHKCHYPDTYEFLQVVSKLYKQVDFVIPNLSFGELKELVKRWEISKARRNHIMRHEPIIEYVKKHKIDLQFVWLRKEESNTRKMVISHRWDVIESKQLGVRTAWMLSNWKSLDVRTYIVTNWLPYNTLYDKYAKFRWWKPYKYRVGWYLSNTAIKHWEAEFMRIHYPDIYEANKHLLWEM